MKENQKTLLNSKIKVEELEKISKIITKKALKVISCSGSVYALKLLENKDIDTLNDLQQEVSLQIILDNYIITRNAFKVVRSFIYHNFEKTECEIFTSEEQEEKSLNNVFYCSFLSNSNENTKKATRIDLKKLYSILSERQQQVFKYYFINNMKQIDIAKMFECGKKNINNLINDIKIKAKKCISEV